jgi:hypothetical protein
MSKSGKLTASVIHTARASIAEASSLAALGEWVPF